MSDDERLAPGKKVKLPDGRKWTVGAWRWDGYERMVMLHWREVVAIHPFQTLADMTRDAA